MQVLSVYNSVDNIQLISTIYHETFEEGISVVLQRMFG